MILTAIESPVRATDVYTREQHMRYFYECCLDSIRRGEAPYGSHWMTAFLDDDDPLDRATGIRTGYLWSARAGQAALYVDLGVSDGMNEARKFFEARHIPVHRRTLGYQVIKMIQEMASDSALPDPQGFTEFA